MARSRTLFVGATLVAATLAGAALAQPSGREILETQKDRLGVRDEEQTVSMELVDSRGRSRSRTVQMWSLDPEDGQQKLLLVFREPRDVDGTSLLTWEQADRDDDQWLYLPSARKEKRIAAGAKRNRFMGTEFTFEDLRGENLERHDYELVGEESLDGALCFQVVATPRTEDDQKDSGYSKRLLWIRKDNYVTAGIDYFDRAGKNVKELRNREIVQLEGGIFRSDLSVMKNLASGAETRLKVLERKIDQGLDEQHFTLRNLRSL